MEPSNHEGEPAVECAASPESHPPCRGSQLGIKTPKLFPSDADTLGNLDAKLECWSQAARNYSRTTAPVNLDGHRHLESCVSLERSLGGWKGVLMLCLFRGET